MTVPMGRVVCDITTSADGYSAGLNQSEERPFGDDGGDGWGGRLHGWMFDDTEANRAETAQMTTAKAFIMGRNMFGPVRGEWDRTWNGWWGDDPPYHAPVFVLTHYAREPQPMAGETTFYFVTDGIESALAQARRRPARAMLRSRAARPPSTSTLPPGSSTSCGYTSRRSRSAPEHGCSTVSRP